LPNTLAQAGLDGRLDPWGNPYIYLNIANANPGEVRRDKNLNPVNTDFDLYSMGRDGETNTAFTAKKARDDVVRANNGGFLGLAEDY
jgi:general secretion pathway protein G